VVSSNAMPGILGKISQKVKEHIPNGPWKAFPMGKALQKEPVNPRQRLAQNLTALMKAQELSSVRVGNLAKVDPKTVNNLMHGRFDPRLSLVEKVANVFGMSAWQLLATDFSAQRVDSIQVMRLLERYSKASEDVRAAIMQVAQIAQDG
jgi:transcriptional regulator with XRE-family HTH domain